MLWLIIGILLGVALNSVFVASRGGRLQIRWYQWVLWLVAIGFFLLGIQNYLALQDELETKLATFALLAFGLSGVVAAALGWALPLVFGRRGPARQGNPEAETV